MTAPDRPAGSLPEAGELIRVETVGIDGSRAHVRVSGDLDLATVAPLSAVLHGHLAAGRRYLRLDLSGVRFLDAAALSGITEAHHAALARRGTMTVTGLRPATARVLRLARLDRVLFVGGPRDELSAPEPTSWPERTVPWTPLAAARTAATTPG